MRCWLQSIRNWRVLKNFCFWCIFSSLVWWELLMPWFMIFFICSLSTMNCQDWCDSPRTSTISHCLGDQKQPFSQSIRRTRTDRILFWGHPSWIEEVPVTGRSIFYWQFSKFSRTLWLIPSTVRFRRLWLWSGRFDSNWWEWYLSLGFSSTRKCWVASPDTS